MKKADYESVCSKMRLADGTLWTMPITLDVSKEFAEKLKPGDERCPPRRRRRHARRHQRRRHLGTESRAGSRASVRHDDTSHPAVNYLMNQSKPVYIGGTRRVPAAAAPLRLQVAPQLADATSRGVRQARLDEDRRLPNPQPDAPRAPRAHAPRRQGRRRQPARASGRRHDQAGRRRPLHARPLLPGARCRTIRRTRPCSRSCRSRCEWAARAKPSGTPSFARTTAARTSSSAATTPAPARTTPASRSTVRTMPKSSCRSMKKSSA